MPVPAKVTVQPRLNMGLGDARGVVMERLNFLRACIRTLNRIEDENGSWKVLFRSHACIGTMNLTGTYERVADWEVGDIADLEICATWKRFMEGMMPRSLLGAMRN